MKYKYEFDFDDFEKGCCIECPLTWEIVDSSGDYTTICVLGRSWRDCPLEEVEDD